MPPTALLVRCAATVILTVTIQAATRFALADPQDRIARDRVVQDRGAQDRVTQDPWAQIRLAPDPSAQDSSVSDDASAVDTLAVAPKAPDLSALDLSGLALPAQDPSAQASAARNLSSPKNAVKSQDPAFANRKDNKDGSSQVTVGTNIPTDWQTKVGVDLGLAPTPSLRPAQVENLQVGSAIQDGSSGAAWANLTAPGPVPLAWDKTSVDARVDPLHEQSRLGTTLSRTVLIDKNMSMTLQNGYAVTQSLSNTPMVQQPFDPFAIPAPRPSSGAANVMPAPQIWSNEDAVRFNLSSTGTTLSVGAKVQSTDEHWLRSLSAEQKLFGGPISVTGALTETPTGDISKSIMAGFKQAW
jgi:hypothetical protein